MKVRQILENLLDQFEQYIILHCEQPLNKLRDARDCFKVVENRQQLQELIYIMLQPRNEKAFVKSSSLRTRYDNGKSHITISEPNGIGLKLNIDDELELLNFLDGPELKPKALAAYIGRRLTQKAKIHKIKSMSKEESL